MLNIGLQVVWGSRVYKQCQKSVQSLYSYTDKTFHKLNCALIGVLGTGKQLHMLVTFHYQNRLLVPVPEIVLHTIHRTYYNNNYLNKYNSSRRD